MAWFYGGAIKTPPNVGEMEPSARKAFRHNVKYKDLNAFVKAAYDAGLLQDDVDD
jgi:hypothetical protein